MTRTVRRRAGAAPVCGWVSVLAVPVATRKVGAVSPRTAPLDTWPTTAAYGTVVKEVRPCDV